LSLKLKLHIFVPNRTLDRSDEPYARGTISPNPRAERSADAVEGWFRKNNQ